MTILDCAVAKPALLRPIPLICYEHLSPLVLTVDNYICSFCSGDTVLSVLENVEHIHCKKENEV